MLLGRDVMTTRTAGQDQLVEARRGWEKGGGEDAPEEQDASVVRDMRGYHEVISEVQWLVGCHAQVALAARADRSRLRWLPRLGHEKAASELCQTNSTRAVSQMVPRLSDSSKL